MSPKLILEVALDIAVENTIILTVLGSGLGQPFPGAESGAEGAEARSSRSRARAGGTQAGLPLAVFWALQMFF